MKSNAKVRFGLGLKVKGLLLDLNLEKLEINIRTRFWIQAYSLNSKSVFNVFIFYFF